MDAVATDLTSQEREHHLQKLATDNQDSKGVVQECSFPSWALPNVS